MIDVNQDQNNNVVPSAPQTAMPSAPQAVIPSAPQTAMPSAPVNNNLVADSSLVSATSNKITGSSLTIDKDLVKKDGTINKRNMLIFIFAIVICLFVFIYILFFKDKNITDGATQVITVTKTSSIKDECENCSIKFIGSELTFEANRSYDLSKYLIVNNIGIRNVNFSIEDGSLAKISNTKDSLNLTTLNKVGVTTITATAGDKRVTAKVIIEPGVIKAAKLKSSPYYAFLTKAVDFEIFSEPEGVDISNFNLSIENPEIAEINEEGKLVGKMVGETTVYLSFGEEVSSQLIYVSTSDISVTCSVRGKDADCGNIDVTNLKDNKFNVIVTIDDTFTIDDLKYSFTDNGINGTISYDGKDNSKENTYNYLIAVTNIETLDDRSGIVEFTLPDGSSKKIIIK